MDAVIDFGNTQLKIGFFEKGKLLRVLSGVRHHDARALFDRERPSRIAFCDVTGKGSAFLDSLPYTPKLYELKNTMPLPFKLHYQTPETLGVDRIAAVLGAQALFPGETVLLIDLGTCITYELLEKGMDYRVGMISPGLQMRLKAMHHFTAKLPLVEHDDQAVFPLVVNSTRQGMHVGAVKGVLFEMEGIIKHFEDKLGNFKVLLCGGNAVFFESKLKPSIFVEQHLLLVGLNRLFDIDAD